MEGRQKEKKFSKLNFSAPIFVLLERIENEYSKSIRII